MREIKFRAWNKETNKIGEEESLASWCHTEMNNGIAMGLASMKQAPSEERETRHDHLIIMQYTGLKDKNGKDIYEGDIVRYETEDGDVWTASIVWEIGEENRFISGFTITLIRDITEEIYNDEGFAPPNWTGEIEVIGNIYENEELLK